MNRLIKNEHQQYVGRLLATSSGYKKLFPEHQFKNKGYFYEDSQIFALPIKEITQKTYQGEVYNLEVKSNHNYIVNGINVANCTFNGFHEVMEKTFIEDQMYRKFL